MNLLEKTIIFIKKTQCSAQRGPFITSLRPTLNKCDHVIVCLPHARARYDIEADYMYDHSLGNLGGWLQRMQNGVC